MHHGHADRNDLTPKLSKLSGTVFGVSLAGRRRLRNWDGARRWQARRSVTTTVYSGSYTSSKCITKSVTGSGEYEMDAREAANGGFQGSGHVATIAVAGKAKISCSGSSDSGDYTGLQGETATITPDRIARRPDTPVSCHSGAQTSGHTSPRRSSGGSASSTGCRPAAGVSSSPRARANRSRRLNAAPRRSDLKGP